MSHTQRRFLGLIVLVLGLLAFRPITTSAQNILSDDPIQRAWELAAQSGRYDYKTHVEQTTYPAPRVANAGRDPKVNVLGLGGTADAEAEEIEMTLWQDGSFDPTTGVEMQLRDGRSYARRSPTAEWEEIGNISDQVAPDGDPMVWFHAMTNVEQQETQTFPFGSGDSVTLTRYSFDVDGQTFGRYMGDLLYQRAALETPLPRGMRSQIPETYRKMSGTGSLWIDADGLPSRMTLDLDYGEQENGERVSAEIQTDFSNYNRENLISVPFLGNPQQWVAVNADTIVAGAEQTAILSASLALLLLTGLFVLRYHNRRSFYIGYVSLIIFSMVFLPIIDGAVAYAFMDYQNQRQAEYAARVAEAERQQAQRDVVYGNVGVEEGYSVSSIQYSVEEPLNTEDRILNTISSTDTDTDADGLSDEDEDAWGTCAYDGAPTNCTNVLDSTDSDGDGLTDGQEVNSTNTDPLLSDSDLDGISDYLEVTTFTYNGVAYQFDANDTDSNKDGLTDGEECLVWVEGAPEYDLDAVCPDSDGDGVPNPFDDDNDNDNVLDLADISPNTYITNTYSNDNPLQLDIDNLTVDQPVIVQFDFRPTTDVNLTFSGHVLDWPSDDTEGQIQRRLDTTFADTENTDVLSTDENAANGDIRLVPMLEVQMPYSDGHYSNLPITTTASADRVLGDAVDSWIDDTELEGYGITVSDVNVDDGLLVTYLPLTSVTDANSDTVQAYSAIMYYQPSQGTNGIVDWGAAHEYRVVWMVQMLTDQCIDEDADEDTCEREDVIDIIHVYHEEWQLTGLSISEEHGLETAVLYENPAEDDDLDNPSLLTAVAWNLSSTFVNGYDCDITDGDTCTSDGERDVTLAGLDASIDVWTGGDDYLVSTYQTGIHRDQATTLFSADTTTILEDEFTAYADQTDPSLLYLQEVTYRSQSLSESVSSADGLLTFDFDGVSEAVSAAMTLSTYTYGDDGWDIYDWEDYITLLQWQLAQDDDYFTLTGSDSEDDLDGKLIWVRLFYSALYSGLGDVVEVDGDSIYVYIPDDPLGTDYDVITSYQLTGQSMSHILVLTANLFTFSLSTLAGDASFYTQIAIAKAGGTTAATSKYTSLALSINRANLYGNLMLGIAVAAFVMGVAFLVLGLLTDNDLALRVSEIFIQFANLLFIVQFALKMLNIMNAIAGISDSALAAALAFGLANKLAMTMILAVVVTLIVAIGLVVYYLVKYWGRFDSHEARTALSHIIASLVVMTISLVVIVAIFALLAAAAFALFVLGAVLLILLIIFIIVEIILLLLGESTLTERFTTWLADALYGTKTIIKNMNSSDRIDLNIDELVYGDDDLGMTTANTLSYTISLTNTTRTNQGFSKARQATFAYALTQDEDVTTHDDLDLKDIYDEWDEVSDDELQITRTATLTEPISLASVGSGVNRSLDGHLYLIEGYDIPYLGCWKVWNDCTVYSTDGSSPINMGESIVYDVLPATVAEFAVFTSDDETRANNTDWNRNGGLSFPQQQDQDNDGMLSVAQGGTDQNDNSADSDGDFLTDYYEQLVLGTDPEDADSDDDGLTDYQESIYFTNPEDADSDDDGLTDYTEVIEGWLVTIGTADDGSPITTRVWSDPWLADADDDSLNDLQEYIFGFHPEISTDPSVIENLIQISDMSVDETEQAVLWLEMDEDSGASIFTDSSGERHTAYCADDATCPVADVDGRYGTALTFDGTDDYLTVTDGDTINFADGDFTITAWVYRTRGGFQSIISQDDDGDETWEFGFSGNTPRFVFNTESRFWVVAGGTVTANNWHHIAVTRNSVDETVQIYVDGELADSDSNMTGSLSSNAPLLIGRVEDSNDAKHYQGSIDDLLVYERVLSADEVEAVMNGRINPNDRYVQPGQELSYSASVTNTSGTNYAYGHLTGESSYAEPAIAAPLMAMGFEPNEWIVQFVNDTGDSTVPTCVQDVSCPTIGIAGPTDYGSSQYALQFEDASTFVSLPTIGSTSEAALAFWLRADAVPATDDIATIIDTDRDGNALKIYLNDEGKLVLSLDGGATAVFTSNYNFGNNLDTWVHVGFNIHDSYIELYINGSKNGDSISHSTGAFNIGYGTLGNSVDGTQPFTGAFDELFYQSTTAGSDEFSRIRTGGYNVDYEGSNRPDIYRDVLFRFNELDGIVMRNLVNETTMLTCDASDACPTRDDSGAFGTGLEFDGTNGITLDEKLRLQGDYTFAFWAKTSSYADQEVFYVTDAETDAYVVRFFMSSGLPHFYHYYASDGSVADRVGSRMDGGEWRHFAMVLDGTQLDLYVDGEPEGNSSRQVVPHNGTEVQITLGKNIVTSDLIPFVGSLDEFVYIPEATDAEGVQTLMNSTWPAIDVPDEFVTFSADPYTNINVSGTATVSEDAADGLYTIDQEVEAALALQNESITIPVVDTHSTSLDLFLPFEEVPGATVFENIGNEDDYECSDTGCPTAGLRGIIDRAAYFDGVDDGIVVQDTRSQARARQNESVTYALWVKGERGTLFDTDSLAYDGIEADFSGMDIMVDDNVSGGGSFVSTSLSYTIPQNIWTHVVFTFEDDNDPDQLDENGIAKAYINGELVDETTYYRDGNSTLGKSETPTIGRTQNFTNFYKGYLDDFRIYGDVVLSDAEILALYEESAPVMRFEFDEENDAAQYIDSIGGLVGYPSETTATIDGVDVSVLNPIPGTDGQIGNLALFDGAGIIDIPDSENVIDLSQDFTIMTWLQTEESGVGILHKGDGDDLWETGEKQLYLNGQGELVLKGVGNGIIRSLSAINDGSWHHVVVTWDRDAGVGYTYIDGVDDTETSTYTIVNEDNSTDTLQLGKPNNEWSNAILDGKLDELVIYQRTLTQEEAASIYLREIRWYRDHNSANVRVDTDNPTIELLTTSSHFDDGYIQLAVDTEDASSTVRLLEIGLKSPDDSDYTWWSAPECLDSELYATVWCPYFTTAGEGDYEVMFRAVDIVGNETTSSAYTLTVDDTAPTVSSDYAATELNATADTSSDSLSWTVSLNGAVSDSTTRSVTSASGVYADTMTVSLVDGRGEVLGGGAQRATLNGEAWTIDYEVYGLRPVGEVTVVVSAEDQVGNKTEQTVGTIVLDERAPVVTLDTRTTLETYTSTVTFAGTISEQPDWYGKVLDLHFEDDLLDSSEELNDGVCLNCPTYVDGLFGRAASFGATDEVSIRIDNITETLSLAGWLYYDSSVDASIIDLGDGKAQLSILADDGVQAQLTTISGTHTISETGSLTASAWNHIALTWDGETMTAYVNGLAIGSQTIDSTLGDGTTILLGDASQSLVMQLDEVQLYEVALTANEAFALAASDVAGISGVEYWLEQVFTDEVQAEDWQAATLTTTDERLAEWSADVSVADDSEGFYQLNIRGTDANGNQSGDFTAWRGQIDNLAPRLTLEAEYVGTGVAAQTKYTFLAEDLLLDPDQIDTLCSEDEIEFTDTDSIDSAEATCYSDGYALSTTLSACDYAGNCASAEVTPTDNTSAPFIAIEEEEQTITENETVTLSGAISASDGLSYFLLAVGETELYTQTFGTRTTADATWSYEWTPSDEGDYLFNAYLEDENGAFTLRQTNVTVIGVASGPSAVELSSLMTTTPSVPLMVLVLAGLSLFVVVRRRWDGGEDRPNSSR